MSSRCSTCGAWRWAAAEPHKCPPLWHLWCPYTHGDERIDVRGMDAEVAAERWLELSDDEEAAGPTESMRVLVVPEGHNRHSDAGVWLDVGGAITTTYTASEAPPSDEDLAALGMS